MRNNFIMGHPRDDEPWELRFRRKIAPGAAGACKPWLGSVTRDGYGQMGRGSKVYYVHRLVWEEANGPIPDGLVVDHTCHNRDRACAGGRSCPHRRCCNLDHMELVTSITNVRRGRSR